ncbi:MAG: hypothetical protein LBU90_09960 [Bacteroidales bacterium]|jgi:hypothetical protein|nr:hypothetical protein [Bacteroidales bacterium]
MKYKSIREEELKNKVGEDFFANFDTTEILGNIDFTVFPKQHDMFGRTPLLWAEAKTGDYDIPTMFVQLILTIGKARTFDKTLPPAFLGAFDFKKIAFVPYMSVQDIFYMNDFNWNVTPSNHDTREFLLIKERVEATLKQHTYTFDYEKDEKELRHFIKNNIAKATDTSKIKIDKNNFVPIYLRWLEIVKPIIDVQWDDLKKANILDSDFYLADLFVDDKDTATIADDTSIRENLFVIFQHSGYKIAKENLKQMFDATITIRHKDTYQAFWKHYKRPPIKEFQDYIIERRDRLVPQDIRERKGAFFTPRKWVELSQKYIADTLGEDWQDEYYVWDCAAGTGNLLAGLTNKYNIYASTLDQADVNVMHERIAHGANLLKNHVFQFDFLNDDFSKLPQSLQDIINNPEKRKKLVIYINPPYAEGDNVRGIGRKNVHISKTHDKYLKELGRASGELFAQFFARIYVEIPNSVLAEFSKLKILQAPNFSDFRQFFRAKLENFFVVPADTFDNVSGDFPIGFFVWNLTQKEIFTETITDVYDAKGNFLGNKLIPSYDNSKYISDWLEKNSKNISTNYIAHLASVGNDFQNQRMIFIDNEDKEHWKKGGRHTRISAENLIHASVYFAVRKIIPANWLNDRDQFLFPSEPRLSQDSKDLHDFVSNPENQDNLEKIKVQDVIEFQNDCLAYTLFSNNISTKYGVNHWLPFTEQEVDAQEKFESRFMTEFLAGKVTRGCNPLSEQSLFDTPNTARGHAPLLSHKLSFSAEAQTVFRAGRELWKYYHAAGNNKGACPLATGTHNVNASLYDIREYFQGRNDKGKMNNKSTDETYNTLVGNLRKELKTLSKKIEPKVYEYGFLRG